MTRVVCRRCRRLPPPFAATLAPVLSKYRQRIYADYVDAGTAPLAPADISGLAPRRPYLRKLIGEHFPADRGAAILDIGCGHGALIYFARQAGYRRIAGVDASEAQVAAARALGIDGVRHMNLLTALRETDPDSQDAVVAFDVIEHFTKDELIDIVDEVRRILKPGARWIIHVPNGASPFAGVSRYGDLTHELAFTPESLTQLLLASRFRAVDCYEDAPIAHGLKSALRLAAWKMMRSIMLAWLLVETGAAQPRVLSQNMLAVAVK